LDIFRLDSRHDRRRCLDRCLRKTAYIDHGVDNEAVKLTAVMHDQDLGNAAEFALSAGQPLAKVEYGNDPPAQGNDAQDKAGGARHFGNFAYFNDLLDAMNVDTVLFVG